jgi:hypothetical protein
MNEDNTIARREASQPVVQPPGTAMLQQSDLIPRIQLARMFPRDIDEFRLALRKEATSDPSGMVYSKPQGGTAIIGPSVRMAEIAARRFGNLHIGEPSISEHDGRVTVSVVALDLETNVSAPGTASNSLVSKQGKRMSADVVSNLVAAAAAKAKRNAIFSIIGKGVFDELMGACLAAEEARIAAERDAERRSGRTGALWAKHVAGWAKAGMREADLLRACQARTPEDVTPAMLARLNAAVQTVREGTPARAALGLDDNTAPSIADLLDTEETDNAST